MHKTIQTRIDYESYITPRTSNPTDGLPPYRQAVHNLETISSDLSALSFLLSNFNLQPGWDRRGEDVSIYLRSAGDLFRRITECLYSQLETFAQKEEYDNESAVN